MKNIPTILILIDYFLPGYKGGGPAKSIKNLVEHLANDFYFKIITSDRDLGDENPYPDVSINKWNYFNGIEVYYASPAKLKFFSLVKLINKTQYDVLYLNSLFQPVFTIQILLSRRFKLLNSSRIVLAPRGELETGCLEIKSVKKYFYLSVAKQLGLYRNIDWHATSDQEVVSINNIFDDRIQNVIIAPNLTPKLDYNILLKLKSYEKKSRILKICFISRITREKNLDFALNILKDSKIPFEFNVYGTNHEDPNYWNICKNLINDINKEANKTIIYHGSLKPELVIEVFQSHDLFFFPTRGENFGHVIFEAFSGGTPVLISDNTPWNNLAKKGIGWDLPLSQPALFIKSIEYISSISSDEFLEMRKKILDFAFEYSNNPALINLSKKLFA